LKTVKNYISFFATFCCTTRVYVAYLQKWMQRGLHTMEQPQFSEDLNLASNCLAHT